MSDDEIITLKDGSRWRAVPVIEEWKFTSRNNRPLKMLESIEDPTLTPRQEKLELQYRLDNISLCLGRLEGRIARLEKLHL